MFGKSDFVMPDWRYYPLGILIFILPSVAVTVKSGATTVFLLILIPSLVFFRHVRNILHFEEKIFLSCMLLFVILISFSFLNSSDVQESLGSFEKYLRYIVFIPMYIFLRRYQINLAPWLLYGCLLGCFVMACVVGYQHYELGLDRPGGARNAARFGFVAVISLLMLILLLSAEWRNKALFFVGIVVSALVIYAIALNQTRAAMILVLPFFILMIFYFRKNINKNFIIIISIVAFIIGLISMHPSSPIAKRFVVAKEEVIALKKDPIGNYYSSTGLRLHMIHAGAQVFLNNPILGTGLADYEDDVQKLMDEGKLYVEDEMLLTSPHNIYVNMLAETGVLGFFGFIFGVIFAPLYGYRKLSKRKNNNEKIRLYIYAGVTCLMCYLIFGLFHTWTNINNSVSIFLLLHLVFMSNGFNLIDVKNKTAR